MGDIHPIWSRDWHESNRQDSSNPRAQDGVVISPINAARNSILEQLYQSGPRVRYQINMRVKRSQQMRRRGTQLLSRFAFLVLTIRSVQDEIKADG